MAGCLLVLIPQKNGHENSERLAYLTTMWRIVFFST
jgi:hypothetical protein